jgi:hypothetical protein
MSEWTANNVSIVAKNLPLANYRAKCQDRQTLSYVSDLKSGINNASGRSDVEPRKMSGFS